MRQTYTIGTGQRITLEDSDFMAAGGQATIYARGNTIYKVYSDRLDMIPTEKIREIKTLLTLDTIIKPDRVIYDKNGFPAGFTMRWLKNAVSLCRLFTNTYRQTNNIAQKQTNNLVQNIRDGIAFIHERGCLIVDCNGYNILVGQDNHTTPYYIDVDSYQTPTHQAGAITPEIRDFHAKGFSEYSDWFAFAILACQLFLGIHPYRGSHPKYSKVDLQKRMRDNVSIFNRQVTLPSTARPVSTIPPNYKDWLYATLEEGRRTEPPDYMQTEYGKSQAQKHVQSAIAITTTLVASTKAPILRCLMTQYGLLIQTATTITAWGRQFPIDAATTGWVQTKTGDYITTVKSGKLILIDRDARQMETALPAKTLLQTGNGIFAVTEGACTEVMLTAINRNILATAGTRWQTHPFNTQAFDTMLIQWLLGVPYLTLPMMKGAAASMTTIKAPWIAGYKVMDAKCQGNFCVVAGTKNGRYDKHVIILGEDLATVIGHRVLADVDDSTANFVVLPKGIVVHIPEDGRMEIFPTVSQTDSITEIKDPGIRATMHLANDGDTVMAYEDNNIYRISMKQGGNS